MLGLWLPDASKKLAKNPKYAIRLANRDVNWWVSDKGEYGVNIFARVRIE
jgi:hypothetical protein